MGVIISYLIGSIPFAFLIARLWGIDIREAGSGNVGTMNTARSVGWGPALLVFLLDTAKGIAVVVIAAYWQVSPYSAAAAAVLGHAYPVWLGGRGGKGLATALGAALYLHQWGLIAAFAVGWLLIYPWLRHSDLANLMGSVAVAIYAVQLSGNDARLWLAVMAIIIMLRHLRELIPRRRGN
ncbi:MAG: glycerol-3-phosphate acyltransferase [Methylocystaceae bacterium]